MTLQQQEMITRLENELKRLGKSTDLSWKLSNNPESRGFLFGQVSGVTVTVTPEGLMNIPSVRTYHPPQYPTPVIAASVADELWNKQKARDDSDLEKARSRRTGHLGPVVGFNLECQNEKCPCKAEDEELRRKRERGGFNTNPINCA